MGPAPCCNGAPVQEELSVREAEWVEEQTIKVGWLAAAGGECDSFSILSSSCARAPALLLTMPSPQSLFNPGSTVSFAPVQLRRELKRQQEEEER